MSNLNFLCRIELKKQTHGTVDGGIIRLRDPLRMINSLGFSKNATMNPEPVNPHPWRKGV
jgi:hypothetical protein